MLRPLLWLVLSAACAACSRSEPSAPASPPKAPAPAQVDKTPTEDAVPSAPPAREAQAAGDAAALPLRAKQLSQAPLQKRGCSRVDEVTLPAAAHQLLLPTQDSRFEALLVRDDRLTLEWWRGELGAPAAALASRKLPVRVARISVARRAAGSYAVAWVDEQGGVFALSFNTAAFSEPKAVARGADRRFAPALYEDGALSLLAYTASVDGAMHTFAGKPQAGALADVTPPGHGAAAPAFVLGARAPALVVVDARDGVSPLLEVGFDGATPRKAEVRTPVSQPYAPPLLRAVALPEGEIEVAFSAIGKLAATAIGRVPLRRAVPAVALHPSRGYGELHFDAALSGRAAIFALEVPVDEKPDAARLIEIKWLDAQGEGVSLPLTKQGSALRPSIAATPLPGELLVGYVSAGTAHVVRLRCDA